jgi:hypothetical protein
METDENWEDNFRDVTCPSLYVGIFNGLDEGDIRRKAAKREGVHPDIITLIKFDNADEGVD